MKTCPQCNVSVSDEYRFCLNCGTVLESPAKPIEQPLPTLVYQGPIATPSAETPTSRTVPPKAATTVPPTMPSIAVPPSKSSRLSWLPWLVVAACIAAIVVLVTIIAVQKKSSATETVATVQSPEPTPTPTASETALIPNTNEPTPSPSVSPTEEKQETPTPTPTPTVRSADNTQAVSSATPTPAVVIITPTPTATPTPTPIPAPAVDRNRVYSNREVSERARIVSQPKPPYTEEARKNQITGVVVLRVVLKFDGSIGNISVVSGLQYGLTDQAIAAARNIKFTPATKDGVPVSVAAQVEYVFNLY